MQKDVKEVQYGRSGFLENKAISLNIKELLHSECLHHVISKYYRERWLNSSHC